MAATVKTYRALRDGMRVGLSVRNFGDFIPEAKAMDTLGTLLRSNVIEEVYVEQDAIDEWRAEQDERDAALIAEMDDDYSDMDEDGEIIAKPKRKKKKKVIVSAKKSTGKKKIVVKKKGNSNGKEKRLTEQAV